MFLSLNSLCSFLSAYLYLFYAYIAHLYHSTICTYTAKPDQLPTTLQIVAFFFFCQLGLISLPDSLSIVLVHLVGNASVNLDLSISVHFHLFTEISKKTETIFYLIIRAGCTIGCIKCLLN